MYLIYRNVSMKKVKLLRTRKIQGLKNRKL